MAWTQADIDALDAALASGRKTVQYGDKSTTYQSVDEMLKVRALMRSEVASAGATTSEGRSTLATFRRD